MLEKKRIEEESNHSCTPSLVWPFRSATLVRRSFIRKECGKHSIETLFVTQNYLMEIRFFFIAGTQKTLFN
jgi:hypothetical protein